MRAATGLAVLLLAGCAAQGTATTATAGRNLPPGAWVERVLAPELAGVLRTHPRFRGETLSLGLPARATAGASELDRELEARLEEHLIAEPGLRIRPPSRGGCGPEDASYRIGFVTSTGASLDTVQARVWDSVAGEWVAGIGGRWEGRLAGPDARAAARPAGNDVLPGTIEQPVPAGQPAPLAQALAVRLECALAAAGLAGGPVTTDQEGIAALTAHRLSSRFPDPETPAPDWGLTITPLAVDPGHELFLARLASESGTVTASVYRRTREAGPGAAAGPPSRLLPPRLTALACGRDCLGVRAADAGEAVLVAVLAGRGLFSLEGCGSAYGSDGERTVRLRDPDLAWASFYAITADAGAQPVLADLEAQLPRACGAGGGGPGARREWLDTLADLADGPGAGLVWDGLRVTAPTFGDGS